MVVRGYLVGKVCQGPWRCRHPENVVQFTNWCSQTPELSASPPLTPLRGAVDTTAARWTRRRRGRRYPMLKPVFGSARVFARRFSTAPRDRLLAQALAFVPQHGWEGAVVETMRANGLSDQGVALFAKSDLVGFHYAQQLAALRSIEPQAAPGYGRLAELVCARLDMNAALGAARLREAIALTLRDSSPLAPAARPARWLAELADELWYLSGDRSTDTRWYARRGSLLGVYASLELFQARDTSRDFRDTRALAHKLVGALSTTEYAEDSVLEWLQFNAIAAFNVARTFR